MGFVAGFADMVLRVSAIASVLFVDAIILASLFRPGKRSETLIAKCTAVLVLFMIALSVKLVVG